jgi:predicted Na+-dependent transporter
MMRPWVEFWCQVVGVLAFSVIVLVSLATWAKNRQSGASRDRYIFGLFAITIVILIVGLALLFRLG